MTLPSDPSRSGGAIPVASSRRLPPRRFDWSLFGWLASADLVLILIYLAGGFLVIRDLIAGLPDLWNISRDWSIAEMIGYAKWAALIVIMVLAYQRLRMRILLALALMFAYALMDDSLQLHENHNDRIADATGLVDQNSYALKELVFFAAVGLAFVIPLLIIWLGTARQLRLLILPLLGLFVGVAVCASLVDLLHAALPDRSVMAGLAGALEEGGEMLFLSALLSYGAGTFWPRPTPAD